MKKLFFKTIIIMLAFALCGQLQACSDKYPEEGTQITAENAASGKQLAPVGQLIPEYSDQFYADFYDEGYICLHISDGTDYVIVPQGKKENDLGVKDAVIIRQGTENIYLAASSAMDLFAQLDALENIAFCSTKAEDYSVTEAVELIARGDIQYIGKYSAPDYETILASGCGLAIESTMIYHSPSIKEQLETLGVPVFVERSSYESTPLGRLEWIKVYGLLLGREEAAEQFFAGETAKLDEIRLKLTDNGTEKRQRAAFFYISTNGYVNVRKPGDYISAMIDMAGGEYALSSIAVETDNAMSAMNINWEEFYANVVDADVLIYNGTVDGGINSIEDLIEKNALFADFKAVQNGNVYSSDMNMYQRSSAITDVIIDFYRIFNREDQSDLNFLHRVD